MLIYSKLISIVMICVLAALIPIMVSCAAEPCKLENATGKITDGILVTVGTNETTIVTIDGQSLQISLSVANVDPDKNLVFMSGQQYEFYILDNTGNVVWTYSGYNGIAYTQAIKYDAVTGCSYYPLYEPMGGGTRKNTITVSWNGEDNSHNRLPPGAYTVYAALTTTSPYESNRKVVFIEGPVPIGLNYGIR